MKMSFKTTRSIQLISEFPLILLFVLSTYVLYITYGQFQNITNLDRQVSNAKILNALSVNLGNERGLSAAYLRSKNISIKDIVEQQHIKTNDTIKKFKSQYKQDKNDRLFTNISRKLKNLKSIRDSILSGETSADSEKLNFYGEINELIIGDIRNLNRYATNSNIGLLSNSLIVLYKDIEYTGRERSLMSRLISLKQPLKQSDLNHWIELMENANAFDISLLPEGKTKFNASSIFNSTQSINTKKEIKSIKSEIMLASNSGEFSISSTAWFSILTDKINMLNSIANRVQKDLTNDIDSYYNEVIWRLVASTLIWLIAVVLLIVGFFLARQIKRNIQDLEQVFKKVGEVAGTDEEVDLQTTDGTAKAYNIINQAVENIAREKESALEANAAKSIFLANMSHEIRTPLNGIIGFTELLKNSDLDGEKLEFVEVIEKSSENLLTIINNILDLSKIESTKIELEEILFSPIKEFENAIEVYGPKASEKNIHLNSFIDPSLSNNLKGDITKIKEVIINLLSNAVKFTGDNGKITTVVERLDSENNGFAQVRFSVTDTGIGISQDRISDVFDAFSQADSTITRKYGGTGLGLTISSQFVEMMGGQLNVSSEEGKGSCFYFTLELEESPSNEKDYNQAFSNYNAFLHVPNSNDTTYSDFIKRYLTYFGASSYEYTSLDELDSLKQKELVNLIILNFDYLTEKELNEYRQMKIPIILVMKSLYQNRFSEFDTEYITPIFEPINISKLIKLLTNYSEIASKIKPPVQKIEEPKPAQIKESIQDIQQPINEDIKPQILEDKQQEPKQEIPSVDTISQPIPKEEEKLQIPKPPKPIYDPNKFGTKFKAKVLVAEDNDINQKLITRMLSGIGLEITTAPNGLMALQKRQSGNYDLIFMDIAMPIMGGIEATNKIIEYEQENGLPHIPIIALTANALKGDRERFMEQGLDEYITKPVRRENILHILNMFLQSHMVDEDRSKQASSIETKDNLDTNTSNQKPEIKVAHEEPQVKVVHEEPATKVTHEKPQVKVAHEEPEIKVVHEERATQSIKMNLSDSSEPEIKVVHDEPQVKVVHEEPKIKVVHDEPEIKVIHEEPTMQNIKMNLSDSNEPEIKVLHEEPQVKVVHEEPEIKVIHDEPQVKIIHDEPEIKVIKDESDTILSFDKDKDISIKKPTNEDSSIKIQPQSEDETFKIKTPNLDSSINDDPMGFRLKQQNTQKPHQEISIEQPKVEEEPPIQNVQLKENLSDSFSDAPHKDILVFKKSSIETKIFSNVLSQFIDTVDECDSLPTLEIKLKESHYSIILFDYEIENINLNELSKWIKKSESYHGQGKIKSIMFADSSQKISQAQANLFDKVIQTLINRTELERIIQEYIKR